MKKVIKAAVAVVMLAGIAGAQELNGDAAAILGGLKGPAAVPEAKTRQTLPTTRKLIELLGKGQLPGGCKLRKAAFAEIGGANPDINYFSLDIVVDTPEGRVGGLYFNPLETYNAVAAREADGKIKLDWTMGKRFDAILVRDAQGNGAHNAFGLFSNKTLTLQLKLTPDGNNIEWMTLDLKYYGLTSYMDPACYPTKARRYICGEVDRKLLPPISVRPMSTLETAVVY